MLMYIVQVIELQANGVVVFFCFLGSSPLLIILFSTQKLWNGEDSFT